jgi:hypothetical protein
MSTEFGSWHLEGADSGDMMMWSNGSVECREDLYSAKIFGARSDFAPDRDALSADEAVRLTDRFHGGLIEPDAARARRRNMGKINLTCFYRHPLTNVYPLVFVPVLPIEFRVNPDGGPNRLGLRYEAVFDAHARHASAAPPKGSKGYGETLLRGDRGLDAAISDLIGMREGTATRTALTDGGEANNLLELLHDCISRLSEDVDVVARACGLVVAFTAKL